MIGAETYHVLALEYDSMTVEILATLVKHLFTTT